MTVLIKNGTLIDPLNRVHEKRSLLIEDGKIAFCSETEPTADRVLDAQGKIVAPGFIDVHLNEGGLDSDGAPDDSLFLAEMRMGVTSALSGNCGKNSTDSSSEFLSLIERSGIPVNLGLFASHSETRLRAGGSNKYVPIDGESLNRMLRNLEKELAAGCIGVSLNLDDTPGTTFNELLEVGSLCKRANKPISVHPRKGEAGAVNAVREIAEVARLLGIQAEISHIDSAVGFDQMQEILQMLHEYTLNGTQIGIDWCPYDALGTEPGMPALLRPYVMLVTSGLPYCGNENPSAAGAFSYFLKSCLDTGTISLDEAIAKLTGLPAQRFGLTGKGRLSVGADADIVIFDPEKISEGGESVLVGGEIAIWNGRVENLRLGRALRF